MKDCFNSTKAFFLAMVCIVAFYGAETFAAPNGQPAEACTVEDLFTDIDANENCMATKQEESNPANPDETTCGKYTNDPNNQPGGGGEVFISVKVFSAIICRVVQLMREIAGTMWCGVSNGIVEPLGVAMVLFVTCMGIMFTIGTIQPSRGQLTLIVLKMSILYALATDGALAIRYGYDFFMTAATDGISMVLTHNTQGGEAVTPTTIINGLDEMFTAVFFSNAPIEESGQLMSVFAGFAAISSAVPLGVTLGSFLMLTVFYSLFVFLKAIMTYLFAITGITFLCAMMPIFIGFGLFKTTSSIFWGWLGALVSFTIQPIILFAFLIMVNSHLRDALDDLACVIQERVVVDKQGQFNSDGTIISLLDPNKYHLTQAPCVYGSDPDSPACKYIDPYQQWDNSMEFLNDTTIPIISALILLVLTNTFLGYVPEIAQQLSMGMMGYAAPAIGGSGYSGGSYSVRHGMLDSVDKFMRSFNDTGGQNGFLRNPLITNERGEQVPDKERLELNPQAFIDQATKDQAEMMKSLGINDPAYKPRPGKDLYTDRANYAKSTGTDMMSDDQEDF